MSKYNDINNPIQGVRAVGGSTWTDIPTPSSYQYILSDISASDAGRTEDTAMQKERIAQYRKLELEWSYITTAEISQILTAFQDEYFEVQFLDALSGGYDTAEFYVGDRTAPLYSALTGLWEGLTLNIIERTGFQVEGNV